MSEDEARDLLVGTIRAIIPDVSLRDAERLAKAIEVVSYLQGLRALSGFGKFVEKNRTK